MMQGTSTKLTAAGVTGWVVIIFSYVLFTATWGPQWAQPPAEVVAAFTGLVSVVAGWLVPEKALNPTLSNGAIQ
jgi:predicted lysophospholipase L1 biosynthesis ABC-type transport system permease subunit